MESSNSCDTFSSSGRTVISYMDFHGVDPPNHREIDSDLLGPSPNNDEGDDYTNHKSSPIPTEIETEEIVTLKDSNSDYNLREFHNFPTRSHHVEDDEFCECCMCNADDTPTEQCSCCCNDDDTGTKKKSNMYKDRCMQKA